MVREFLTQDIGEESLTPCTQLQQYLKVHAFDLSLCALGDKLVSIDQKVFRKAYEAKTAVKCIRVVKGGFFKINVTANNVCTITLKRTD